MEDPKKEAHLPEAQQLTWHRRPGAGLRVVTGAPGLVQTRLSGGAAVAQAAGPAAQRGLGSIVALGALEAAVPALGAASPAVAELPCQPRAAVQGQQQSTESPPDHGGCSPPATALSSVLAQHSQSINCPPRPYPSSDFRRFYLLTCDLPLIPSLYSNKERPTN